MSDPLVLSHAALSPLWEGLDLRVRPGEFLTVLGPNGAGKSTLLSAIMGARRLSAGTVRTTGAIGYIPQQRMFPPDLPLRARDLVSLALRHGVLRARSPQRGEVDEALAAVGATGIAEHRVGLLSGGQQQLLRQAQALARRPALVLADEPLLSLDPAAQAATVARLDAYRRSRDAAVVFVTHSINPVLGVTDRVLYLGPRGHLVGTVDEVMRSETLSALYGSRVDVVRVNDRLVVL
ncbi:ATP-binding cassette domain-containing protein [Corynebacterium sp. zg-331]|uniref:metal ABC transporter ATP-binding protein n=1 Tax=unclassified Corynebacterium TaxID=2624378 RepID=UPI00128E42E1|nr:MULTISPECIES: ATP-binding cassette domain-containing protein [unclassified Corynebacterium]MBC3185679.1 ATP-binding cassette domain-containing protein [Corynebacterium sp. zg-331]MPV52172.1 ATP-binding cassette domain-containing protein [Corynebacterium sp. zg331]